MKIYKGKYMKSGYRELGLRIVRQKYDNYVFVELCLWRYFIGITKETL